MGLKLFSKKKPKEELQKLKMESEAKPKYANLAEVMDYKVPYEMYYSGVEGKKYLDGLYDCGVRTFLMSYYHISSKGIYLPKSFEGKEGIKLFVDSGAFSFFTGTAEALESIEAYEEYVKKYLQWARKNRKYIFAIANCDFEDIVGGEVVDRWNKQYFEPFMLETGIPVCFIWHKESTLKTWEQYCQRYPYTGFSSVSGGNYDRNESVENLRVAEKYNCLVHGMGMTRVRELAQLPYYTTDSTSWKAGIMYGKVAFWADNKIKQLDKDQWKGEYLDRICAASPHIDREKLLDEDEIEMLKASATAYMKATEFIQFNLQKIAYWLKARVVKHDMDNLPADFYPTYEQLVNRLSQDELKEYALKFNVNPEWEECENTIVDITILLNWDEEEYAEGKEKYLANDRIGILHDYHVNRIVTKEEEKISDLQKFFRECVSGESDRLLHIGTNFDRTVKERDDYLEDEEETELVDIEQQEVQNRILAIMQNNSVPVPLKEGMPDIDALDEEIFSQANIVPSFDSRGKFLKGQIAARKPKALYSKKFPKFACDTCYAAQKCPEYKSGYVCAYSKLFDRFTSRKLEDVDAVMSGMVDRNITRMQRMMVLETITGSDNPMIDNMTDRVMRQLQQIEQIRAARMNAQVIMSQQHVVKADGSTERVTTVQANPQSGSILERLFAMSMNNKEDKKEEAPKETVEAEVVKE